jgi:heme exporter protein D
MILHLDAGKYAAFLWPAYGLSAWVIAGLVIDSLMRSRRWRRAAEAHKAKPDEPPETL